MAFDFTSALQGMRRVVHDTMKVPAIYRAAQSDVDVAVTVRWHNKLLIHGNLGGDGYADVIEGIDRLIFNSEELAEKSIVLHRAGTIALGPQWKGAVFILEAREPSEGPINEVWKVAR